jgi:hypothetical protein
MIHELTLPAIGLVLLTAVLVAGVAMWCVRCVKSRQKADHEEGTNHEG